MRPCLTDPCDVVVQPWSPCGDVRAIASKSVAHRMLIAAALSDAPTHIECTTTSQDIEATASCLRALGARVEAVGGGWDVGPVSRDPVPDTSVRLDCGESGSTLRFLMPVAPAVGRHAVFDGAGRLPARPREPLATLMREHGCRVTGDAEWPMEISGTLHGGDFSLPGDVSSQFATGLLLALPVAGGGSVALTGNVESRPYIEITLAVLAAFGVAVEVRDADGGLLLSVGGYGSYRSPGRARVEGDWSNAAFWLAAGALSGDGVLVKGLDHASRQGDRAVVEVLGRFGAAVDVDAARGSVRTAAGTGLRGIELDVRHIPDLVPVLAVVAAQAAGQTRFYNAGRLRLKESDRISTTASLVRALGARAVEEPDALVVEGRAGASFDACTVDAAGDHRICMAAAVAAAATAGPVRIDGAHAAAKSYPGFFDDLVALGGECGQVSPCGGEGGRG